MQPWILCMNIYCPLWFCELHFTILFEIERMTSSPCLACLFTLWDNNPKYPPVKLKRSIYGQTPRTKTGTHTKNAFILDLFHQPRSFFTMSSLALCVSSIDHWHRQAPPNLAIYAVWPPPPCLPPTSMTIPPTPHSYSILSPYNVDLLSWGHLRPFRLLC